MKNLLFVLIAMSAMLIPSDAKAGIKVLYGPPVYNAPVYNSCTCRPVCTCRPCACSSVYRVPVMRYRFYRPIRPIFKPYYVYPYAYHYHAMPLYNW